MNRRDEPEAKSGVLAARTGSIRRMPHEVRLVGGLWKRSKLPVLDRPGLRPTPDRVRETLFNWLGQDLTGWHCLDAFAGSGALGFEAASRGAARVVLLDRDRRLTASLSASAQRLGAIKVRVECADALSWLARGRSPQFDLVFLDPPFDLPLIERAMTAALPWVKPQGLIYVESPQALTSVPPGWLIWRGARAGAVHFHLLQCQSYTAPAPWRA